ncbi:hypothetical protein OAG24_00040 [bacterium]|nr:hypothetical protein [bacterium]
MSDLSYYLSNPDWADKMAYAKYGTFNNNFLPRWVQGSVGGNSSMFITSNPQMFINMKHGSNNINPYRANMAGCVGGEMMKGAVANCGACVGDPVGCTFEGLEQVRSNSQYGGVNPHGISYATGRPPNMVQVLPNDRRYD